MVQEAAGPMALGLVPPMYAKSINLFEHTAFNYLITLYLLHNFFLHIKQSSEGVIYMCRCLAGAGAWHWAQERGVEVSESHSDMAYHVTGIVEFHKYSRSEGIFMISGYVGKAAATFKEYTDRLEAHHILQRAECQGLNAEDRESESIKKRKVQIHPPNN